MDGLFYLMEGLLYLALTFTATYGLPVYLTYRNIMNSVKGKRVFEPLLMFGVLFGAWLCSVIIHNIKMFELSWWDHSIDTDMITWGFWAVVLLFYALAITGFYAKKVPEFVLYSAIAVIVIINAAFIIATVFLGVKYAEGRSLMGFVIFYDLNLLILSVRYIKGALK